MNILKSILGNTRRADISFHSSGKIDITSRIANMLAIGEGDVVDIMTGEGEFYLYVRSRSSDILGRHEARCYPSKRGGRHFRTYCRRLSDAVIQKCGGVSSVWLAAGETVNINGTKAVTLIMRNLTHNAEGNQI